MNSKNFCYYLNTVIKRDLINKYNYKNGNSIPCVRKVILTMGGRVTELNTIAQCCLALEFLLGSKCFIITSKKSDSSRKIRVGSPVGAGVSLKKKQMYTILSYLLLSLTSKHTRYKKIQNYLSFSFSKQDILNFETFEFNRHVFKTLPELKITLVFDKNLLEFEQELFKSL